MKINCNWEKCTTECKYYYICNLRNPLNIVLISYRQNIRWILRRLEEVTKGINAYTAALNDNSYVASAVQHILTKKEIHAKIKDLQEERALLLSQLHEYQIKEKNVHKILKRREQ